MTKPRGDRYSTSNRSSHDNGGPSTQVDSNTSSTSGTSSAATLIVGGPNGGPGYNSINQQQYNQHPVPGQLQTQQYSQNLFGNSNNVQTGGHGLGLGQQLHNGTIIPMTLAPNHNAANIQQNHPQLALLGNLGMNQNTSQNMYQQNQGFISNPYPIVNQNLMQEQQNYIDDQRRKHLASAESAYKRATTDRNMKQKLKSDDHATSSDAQTLDELLRNVESSTADSLSQSDADTDLNDQENSDGTSTSSSLLLFNNTTKIMSMNDNKASKTQSQSQIKKLTKDRKGQGRSPKGARSKSQQSRLLSKLVLQNLRCLKRQNAADKSQGKKSLRNRGSKSKSSNSRSRSRQRMIRDTSKTKVKSKTKMTQGQSDEQLLLQFLKSRGLRIDDVNENLLKNLISDKKRTSDKQNDTIVTRSESPSMLTRQQGINHNTQRPSAHAHDQNVDYMKLQQLKDYLDTRRREDSIVKKSDSKKFTAENLEKLSESDLIKQKLLRPIRNINQKNDSTDTATVTAQTHPGPDNSEDTGNATESNAAQVTLVRQIVEEMNKLKNYESDSRPQHRNSNSKRSRSRSMSRFSRSSDYSKSESESDNSWSETSQSSVLTSDQYSSYSGSSSSSSSVIQELQSDKKSVMKKNLNSDEIRKSPQKSMSSSTSTVGTKDRASSARRFSEKTQTKSSSKKMPPLELQNLNIKERDYSVTKRKDSDKSQFFKKEDNGVHKKVTDNQNQSMMNPFISDGQNAMVQNNVADVDMNNTTHQVITNATNTYSSNNANTSDANINNKDEIIHSKKTIRSLPSKSPTLRDSNDTSSDDNFNVNDIDNDDHLDHSMDYGRRYRIQQDGSRVLESHSGVELTSARGNRNTSEFDNHNDDINSSKNLQNLPWYSEKSRMWYFNRYIAPIIGHNDSTRASSQRFAREPLTTGTIIIWIGLVLSTSLVVSLAGYLMYLRMFSDRYTPQWDTHGANNIVGVTGSAFNATMSNYTVSAVTTSGTVTTTVSPSTSVSTPTVSNPIISFLIAIKDIFIPTFIRDKFKSDDSIGDLKNRIDSKQVLKTEYGWQHIDPDGPLPSSIDLNEDIKNGTTTSMTQSSTNQQNYASDHDYDINHGGSTGYGASRNNNWDNIDHQNGGINMHDNKNQYPAGTFENPFRRKQRLMVQKKKKMEMNSELEEDQEIQNSDNNMEFRSLRPGLLPGGIDLFAESDDNDLRANYNNRPDVFRQLSIKRAEMMKENNNKEKIYGSIKYSKLNLASGPSEGNGNTGKNNPNLPTLDNHLFPPDRYGNYVNHHHHGHNHDGPAWGQLKPGFR